MHHDDRGIPYVLLQKRSLRCHHGGTWGLPGGARDSHEDAVTSALREAHEEAALGGGGAPRPGRLPRRPRRVGVRDRHRRVARADRRRAGQLGERRDALAGPARGAPARAAPGLRRHLGRHQRRAPARDSRARRRQHRRRAGRAGLVERPPGRRHPAAGGRLKAAAEPSGAGAVVSAHGGRRGGRRTQRARGARHPGGRGHGERRRRDRGRRTPGQGLGTPARRHGGSWPARTRGEAGRRDRRPQVAALTTARVGPPGRRRP
ncbi:NUDIX domain-containing protein [Nonomuraea salmonea]|uniref:NUDIX domain-containing protein n=1 Tax=Nonomuraea salmonea TaxID=46181 RepID=UPI0031F0980B